MGPLGQLFWFCSWVVFKHWAELLGQTTAVTRVSSLFFFRFIWTMLYHSKRKEIAKLFPFFKSYNTIRSSQRPPSIVRWNCFSFIYSKADKSQWLKGFVNVVPEKYSKIISRFGTPKYAEQYICIKPLRRVTQLENQTDS